MTEGVGGKALGLKNAWEDLTESIFLFGVSADGTGGLIDGITKAISGMSQALDAATDVGGLTFLAALFGGEAAGDAVVDAMSKRQRESRAAVLGMSDAGGRGRRGRVGVGGRPPAETFGALDMSGLEGPANAAIKLRQEAEEMFFDWRESNAETNAMRMVEITNWEEDEKLRIKRESSEEQAAMADEFGRQFGSLASMAVGALFDAAEGQSIALDRMVSDFFSAQGKQLIAQGTVHTFTGIAKGLMSLGTDPTAGPLIATGAAEIAQGAIWAGAGAAIGAASAPGGSPSSSRPESGGGAGGAGGYSRQGDTMTTKEITQQTTINVIGDLTDRDAQIIQQGLQRSRGRGFVAV
jgi:hypothetical protein